MLSLFAPYTAEEMWERLGHEPTRRAGAAGRQVDPALLVEESVTCVVQVDGKVRDRLEVRAGHRARTSCASWRWRSDAVAACAGRAARSARSSCGRPGWSTSCPPERRPDASRPGACRHGRDRHRLDGVPAAGSCRRARHHGRPAAGRHRRRRRTTRASGRQPGDGRRRAAGVDPVSTSRPRRRVRRAPTSRPRRQGCDRHRLGAPVRRHVRHLRVGGSPPATPRSRCASSTRGRSAWGSASRSSPPPSRPPRSRSVDEVGGRGGEARRRRPTRGLLRRHPGVPAPRRPDRRGGRAARLGAGGQAAAAPRRRPHRAAGEGAHVVARDRPAGGARRGAAATRPVDVAVHHLATPTGPAALAERLRDAAARARATCTSARSARSSARTSGRACSASSSRPGERARHRAGRSAATWSGPCRRPHLSRAAGTRPARSRAPATPARRTPGASLGRACRRPRRAARRARRASLPAARLRRWSDRRPAWSPAPRRCSGT